jgi:uncharacterized membrane protein YfcA
MVPGVLGAVIGGIIDRQFDGTIRPLAIGFLVSSVIAYLAWRQATLRDAPIVSTTVHLQES